MTPDQIKSIREALQMTQAEFAARCGLAGRSAVCRYEKGNRPPSGPLLKLLEMLAEQVERRRKPNRN